MFKLEQYKILAVSVIATTALLTTSQAKDVESSAYNGLWNAKKDISGGVYYPIMNGQTGPYKVNTQVYKNSDISKNEEGLKVSYNHGRVPTANEYNAWNKDINGKNEGLPEGSGYVDEGEALYEAQCIMCHGDFGSGGGGYPALSLGKAKELKRTLTNNRWLNPTAEGPSRVFGSYWPVASTMFWYIKDAMPHTKSKTLTNDEVYSLTAYMLYINSMKVNGEIVNETFKLDKEKFLKIEMPNRNGFIPDIDGANGVENVRSFYTNPDNFGAIRLKKGEEPCMSNCQNTDNISRVDGGITDFNPPISVVRDLPAKKDDAAHTVSFDAKEAYKETCTMCHGSFAPAAGDKAAWKPFLDKGLAAVYKNGLEGTNMGMPAKGGSGLSDEEFKKVVDYILKF
ncbi:MAG: MFS transporter [Epsilonproteobacteria bacterium]|nr:MAG: MFS transporter [Campylobacterota bacterium]